MSGLQSLSFEAPGPGEWRVDGVHQPRPVSKLFTEFVAESRQQGQIVSAERYGSFARGAETRYIHRFVFGQPRVLIPRPPGDEASARTAFGQALQADDVRRLIAAAARVFPDRLWREDVRWWDDEVKPVLMARTLELATTDVSALSNDELVEHIDACIEHLKGAGTWHHTFNNTWMVPLGDFAAHAIEWTGLAPARLASLLRGSSLLSAGDTPERARLVAALATDSGAAAVLASDLSPAECIERLMALPGEAGVAARLYIRTIGYLSMGGFDVIDRYALERPDAIVDGIRRSLTGQGTAPLTKRRSRRRRRKCEAPCPRHIASSSTSCSGRPGTPSASRMSAACTPTTQRTACCAGPSSTEVDGSPAEVWWTTPSTWWRPGRKSCTPC